MRLLPSAADASGVLAAVRLLQLRSGVNRPVTATVAAAAAVSAARQPPGSSWGTWHTPECNETRDREQHCDDSQVPISGDTSLLLFAY